MSGRFQELAQRLTRKPEEKKELVYGEIPDNWDISNRVGFDPAYPKEEPESHRPVRIRDSRLKDSSISDTDNTQSGIKPTGTKPTKNEKRRSFSMTISVSAEEEKIIRRYLSDNDLSFSSWARSVLFRSIGRKVPARPRRD